MNTEYCDKNASTYNETKCNSTKTYLEKQNEKTTVDAQSVDMSNQFSYQKMKTWNLALGIAFLGGYLYYKNY